jgi:hypothetical protein
MNLAIENWESYMSVASGAFPRTLNAAGLISTNGNLEKFPRG